MDWGLENRLSQIFNPDTGKTVMLAVDHGYFLGAMTGIEKPGETIAPLLPHTDALMITRGVLRASVPPTTPTPIVLRVSGGTSIAGPDLTNENIITSMTEAVRLNVSSVALSVFIGTEHERETLTNLSRLVDKGQDLGMPVLAVTAVGKELAKRDAKYLKLCCRICAELGAHYVKTYYCDDFEKVTEGCPVPVVIAGGPKMETELDAFNLAYDAIQRGAAGVDMGRNIWQNPKPVGMIKGIRAIVQDGKSAEEAHQIYLDE